MAAVVVGATTSPILEGPVPDLALSLPRFHKVVTMTFLLRRKQAFQLTTDDIPRRLRRRRF
jgi:hypothetical protein